MAQRKKSGQPIPARASAGQGPTRWELLATAWRVAGPGRPVSRCCRVRRGPDVELRQGAEGGSWAEGLVTCGSVWECPVCASRKAQIRRAELAAGVERWRQLNPIGELVPEYDLVTGDRLPYGLGADGWGYLEGGSLLLETRTVRHGAGDDLRALSRKMRDARNSYKSLRRYKELRAQAGCPHTVRTEEVTRGRNHGWHPHEHELWFVTRTLGGGTRARIEAELSQLWRDTCVRYDLPPPELEYGLRLDSATYAGAYVAKWGLVEEVSLSSAKAGGHQKGKTPWQLLAAAGEGDELAAHHWRTFASAYRGRRQLTWSRGLRDTVLDTYEPAPPESAVVYVASAAEWTAIVRCGGWGLSALFAAVAVDGREGAERVIERALELSRDRDDTS